MVDSTLLRTPWAKRYWEDTKRGKENLELKCVLSSGSACSTGVLNAECASRNFNQQKNQSSRDEGASVVLKALEITFKNTVLHTTTSIIIERSFSPSFFLLSSSFPSCFLPSLPSSLFLFLCRGMNLPTYLCNLSEP